MYYGLEKASMDSHNAAATCYELTMLEIRRTHSLLAGISLEKLSASTKNSSVTATVTIKAECLAHHCLEQELLCVTLPGLNFTEAKTSIFLHHLQ